MALINKRRNVVAIYGGVLFRHKGEGSYFIFRKVGRTEESHVKRNKTDLERQTFNVFSLIYIIMNL